MKMHLSARLLSAILVVLAGSAAHAQSSPSPYTTGTRFEVAGQLTGTISPDPDGSGPLGFAAVRNTYDASGGVLSELGPPPVVGGVRPLKLYSYAQKYAYIKNSAGSLVAAASPVWMPMTTTVCQTLAESSVPTCDAGAPQRVTTNLYGADGTVDDLWLHGIRVTSGSTSLVTCYAYDALGNKISETSLNANFATCS